MGNYARCNCKHHLIIPFMFIVIGLFGILGHFNVVAVEVMRLVWSISFLAVGVLKMLSGNCKCCCGGMCKCDDTTHKSGGAY